MVREDAEDGEVGVGFNGEADLVVEGCEGLGQGLGVVGEGGLGVDVEWGAEFFGEGFDGDLFAIEPVVLVSEMMHGR